MKTLSAAAVCLVGSWFAVTCGVSREAHATVFISENWDADAPTVLNGAALRALPKHEGMKTVFADGCRLSPARLKRESVVFKQIPYEIKQT